MLVYQSLSGKFEYDSPDHCSKQCSIQGIQCMISDISGLPCVFHPVNLVSCTVTYVTYMDVHPLPRLVNYKKGHLSFPSNAVAALWTFMALLEERKIKKTHENTNALGIEWSLKVGNACEGIVASFHRFSMFLFYFSTVIYHFLYDTFVFLSFPYYVLQCPSLYVSNSFPLHSFRFNLVPWIYTYCLKFQTFVILHSFPFTSFTMLLLCIHVLSIYVGFLSFSFVSFHWIV